MKRFEPIKGANEYLPDFNVSKSCIKGKFSIVMYPFLHPTIKVHIQYCRTGKSAHNIANKWQIKENNRIVKLNKN